MNGGEDWGAECLWTSEVQKERGVICASVTEIDRWSIN